MKLELINILISNIEVNFLFFLLTFFSYPLGLFIDFILISAFRTFHPRKLIQGWRLCLKTGKFKEWVHVLMKINFHQ